MFFFETLIQQDRLEPTARVANQQDKKILLNSDLFYAADTRRKPITPKWWINVLARVGLSPNPSYTKYKTDWSPPRGGGIKQEVLIHLPFSN